MLYAICIVLYNSKVCVREIARLNWHQTKSPPLFDGICVPGRPEEVGQIYRQFMLNASGLITPGGGLDLRLTKPSTAKKSRSAPKVSQTLDAQS